MIWALVGVIVISNLLWWWRCSQQARDILAALGVVCELARESERIKHLLTAQHEMILHLLANLPTHRGH